MAIIRVDLSTPRLELMAGVTSSGEPMRSDGTLTQEIADDVAALLTDDVAVSLGARFVLREWLGLPGKVAAIGLGANTGGWLVLSAEGVAADDTTLDEWAIDLRAPIAAVVASGLQRRQRDRQREAEAATRQALMGRLQRESVTETIVGATRGLREVLSQVDQVARVDVPVLILGETGAGKEIIARAVHERSRRSEGPVVRVNCGAIPAELIDSELFGHEKGAFTGANSRRLGWFERAHGGTLFLDEVGELPAAAQVRLLCVLQDGTLQRVGGTSTVTVDVRVVAATHRDLPRMVSEGTFRSDLWYRISVFPLRLPALRDRLEDLPDLVAYFSSRAAERLGAGAVAPSQEDLALLGRHSWPGNIRELAAVIERAVILGHGRRLEVAAALGLVQVPTRSELVDVDQPDVPSNVVRLDDAMVRHIETTLRRTGGRIEGAQGAAALLKINPHTLRSRMRKLGIDWARFRDDRAESPPAFGT